MPGRLSFSTDPIAKDELFICIRIVVGIFIIKKTSSFAQNVGIWCRLLRLENRNEGISANAIDKCPVEMPHVEGRSVARHHRELLNPHRVFIHSAEMEPVREIHSTESKRRDHCGII